jgi:DNA-binding transcriptional LysR family regulator
LAVPRRNLNDLLAFVTVAREGSFTRAAAVLGITQSALSQAIRGLEERLQIRLLTRTTRSVSPTPAGERLMQAIGNRFDEIEAELDALTELRDKPAGTVRITCGDNVLHIVLLPKLAPLLREFPDIKLEFDVNYGFRDIVADRFDAGVRLGNTIDKDMIAVPIGPLLRMAVVASPDYFERDAAYRVGKVGTSASGLVPEICGLSPVLSQPTATLTGVLAGRAGFAHQQHALSGRLQAGLAHLQRDGGRS